MFCQNCGATIEENGEFCVSCGYKIKQEMPVAKEIVHKIKSIIIDSWDVFKIFSVNPVGKISNAFESVEKDRAFWIGVFFAIVFDLQLLIGMSFGINKINGLLGSFGGFRLSIGAFENINMFKMFVIGAIPPICISLASIIARHIFRGSGSYEGDVFVAGASLLPLGFFILITCLLGIANIEVIVILLIITICTMILMLYNGCIKIMEISDGNATLAIPIMLFLSLWFSKIFIFVL